MFDFNEYLSISKKIESDDEYNSKESYRRTAVSRAYYSAFKKSDQYLKIKYPKFHTLSKGKAGHKAVWNTFSIVQSLKPLGIHNTGYRMLEKRKRADYEPAEKITKLDVAFMNKEAEKIIDKLNLKTSLNP